MRCPAPTVLLVDAHADTCELYAFWLHEIGFRVRLAASAADALAIARAEAPDVVVAETMVPGGGPALIRSLRGHEATADALLVVLTTQSSPAVRHAAIAAGADVFAVKPCGAPRLGLLLALGSRERARQARAGDAESRRSAVRAVRRSFAIRERIPPDVARLGAR